MNIRQQILNKMNENQEADVRPYSWVTTPLSLRRFWANYFREKKNS